MCTTPMAGDRCNCGKCGRDCGGEQGICSVDKCNPLPLVLPPPPMIGQMPRIYRVATNGSALFYPIYDENKLNTLSEIHAVSFEGMHYKNLTINIPTEVHVIAADCDRVYFATRPAIGLPGQARGIMHVPLDGSKTPIPVPTMNNGVDLGSDVENILSDNTFMYWTDNNGLGRWRKGFSPDFVRFSKVGPDSQGHGLAMVGKSSDLYVYWSERPILNATTGRIHEVHFADGNVLSNKLLVAYEGKPLQLVADAQNVYWIDQTPGKPNSVMWIERNAPSGTMPHTIADAEAPEGLADTIAIDENGDYLYYIDLQSANPIVFRYEKTTMSGKPEEFVKQGFEPQWLIGDARRLYMASPRSAQIDWVAK